ncbi:MAG: hypothetical protein HY905_14800 [Deltaproteobacteria bacterium]|nr:hypothetical protein [Deltaproteobacteria bacterium]
MDGMQAEVRHGPAELDESYARRIITDFPYPVAKQFTKLRTDECLDPGPLRLKYILATAEALGRFVGALVLCECRELLEKQPAEVPAGLSSQFRRELARPSWGFWTRVTREGSKLLRAAGGASLVRGLDELWLDPKGGPTEVARALDELLAVRNGLSHDRIKAMLPGEFRTLCDRTFPLLCVALERAGLLFGFELAFVSAIAVEKRRRGEPDFVHRFKRISGVSDDFQGAREKLHFPLESAAIILKRRDGPGHLSLEPFYVYEDQAGEAPDIFFLNGVRDNGEIEYAACHRGGRFQSGASARGAELAEEIQHVSEVFDPAGPRGGGP